MYKRQTYSHTIGRPGDITVNILRYAQGGVYIEYFPNLSWSGDAQFSEILTDLDQAWGTGIVFGTYSENVTANLYFKLKPPTSGSYTFHQRSDDNFITFLEGVEVGNTAYSDVFSFTQTLSSSTYYDFRATFREDLVDAFIYLGWSYTGQTEIAIPSNNLYYPDYVDSPLQLTLSGSGGTSKVEESSRPVGKAVGGDGLKEDSEEGEDQNTDDGDGGSSTGEIETGYTGEGGSHTSKDTGTYFTSQPLSGEAKAAQIGVLGTVGASSVIGITSVFLSGGASSAAFAMLNQIQLLILLLLLKIFLPEKIVNYIRSLKMALINLNIDWKFFIVFRKFIEWFDYEQPDNDLYTAGLHSGSSLINIADTLALLGLGILIHILLLILYQGYKESTTNSLNVRLFVGIFRWFSFGYYVRVLFEGFILFGLSSLADLKRYKVFETSQHTNSFFSGIVIFVIIGFLFSTVVTLWLKFRNLAKLKILSKDLFEGLNSTNFSRLYSVIFLSLIHISPKPQNPKTPRCNFDIEYRKWKLKSKQKIASPSSGYLSHTN